MTLILLGTTFYISALLSSPNNSPTQIQKTKASAITYKKEINLADNFGTNEVIPDVTPPSTTTAPTVAALKEPTAKPTLLALAPTLTPQPTVTKIPTKAPTATPVILAREPTDIPEPTMAATEPTVKPTVQPLLAYKSTTVSPTLIPVKETGGMASPVPTKKIQPTGVQILPETGWIQTSSILFIVATTTILFSLLF